MSLGFWLLVMVACGAGAVCRYTLDVMITRRIGGIFPWGTCVVNVSGALAAGVLIVVISHYDLPASVGLIIGGGFLGSYTTFSTWMMQTLQLFETKKHRLAWLNLAGPALAGVAGVLVGGGMAHWLLT